MKRILLFSYLCVGLSCVCFAQQPDTLPAPSPNGIAPLAASPDGTPGIPESTWAENLATQSVENNLLIRRINTPTDKYTGVVDIEVPLYEINTGSGALPISLHYLTTGIRVKEISSIVGLGWELRAGGKITRVVKGQPDNFEQLRITSDLSSWDSKKFELYTRDKWDTEPDLYYYDLPSLSGCFVFDSNGVVHTIPNQKIKIEYNKDNGRFTIYDTEGTKYLFFQYDKEWYLEWIFYPDNTEMRFTYDATVDWSYPSWTEIPNYLTYVTYYPNVSGNKVSYFKSSDKKITTYRKLYSVRLKTITYKEHQIRFNNDEFFVDNLVKQTNKYLTSFDVLWQDSVYRTFHFDYDEKIHTKFKLKSVYEQIANSKEIRPVCKLDYYEDAEPKPDYMGFDHWGFCNSKIENPPVCPSITIGDFTTKEFGASRKPNLALTRAQSLRKITYPNGGSKELIYELHRGVNPRTGREEYAGGLRIKQINERISDDAYPNIRRYEYSGGVWYSDPENYVVKIDSSICIGNDRKTYYKYHLSSHPVTSVSDLNGSSVIYSDIKEYLPNGSWIEYHYVPYESFPDEEPDRTLITQSGPKNFGKDAFGRSPRTTKNWGRKLLLWQKSYDTEGNLVRQENFSYRLDTTTAVRIPGYCMFDDLHSTYYESSQMAPSWVHRYYVGRYEWISCNVLLSKHTIKQTNYHLPEQTNYFHSPKGLLQTIYHRDADGVITTTTVKFPEDYLNRMIRPDTIIKTLIHRNILKPIETVTYCNGKVLEANLTTYKIIGHSNLSGAPTIVPAENYALRSIPTDSIAFNPSRLSINGALVFDKVNYKPAKIFEEYIDGRLCCYKDEQGVYHTIYYGKNAYGKSYPIANITNGYFTDENSTYRNEVYFDDFESFYGIVVDNAKSGNRVAKGTQKFYIPSDLKPGEYILTYWFREASEPLWKRKSIPLSITMENHGALINLPHASGETYIDDLSVIPRNATLESQIRIGPLGVLSQTDARGRVRYYRYNSVGLLVEVSDELGRILKKYTYDPNYIKL